MHRSAVAGAARPWFPLRHRQRGLYVHTHKCIIPSFAITRLECRAGFRYDIDSAAWLAPHAHGLLVTQEAVLRRIEAQVACCDTPRVLAITRLECLLSHA